MKTYIKRGSKNYKEKKLLDELEPILASKKEKDSNFTFTSARNFNELQTLYNNHVAEDVSSSEDISTKTEAKENQENMTEETAETKTKESTSSSQFIDPFNQSEPIVRDYVFGEQSLEKSSNNKKRSTFNNSTFDEPTSFEEAFVIPDDESDDDSKNSSSESKKSPFKSKNTEEQEPMNSKWGEMKGSLQKKKTRKFAKYIVEAVSTLQQKGFVWYANKDINDGKLNEYELNGEMDLSLLVTLADGQEVTVKEFFKEQTIKAEQLSHITAEQKEDLTDSLTEVLMEQGAGPTPTQELMLVTLTIIGSQALTLMTLKAETNSLLTQLRAMNDPEETQKEYKEPWHQQDNSTENVIEDELNDEAQTPNEKVESNPNESVPVTEPLQIGESIETKE